MSQLFKNAARAALAAPIAAADTSLTVDITKADLFPAANTGTDPVNTTGKDWYKVVLEDVNHNIEIAYVRTRTLGSAVMSNVLRGQEGTTALSFATGSIVGLRLTALDLQEAIDLAAQATTPGQDVLWAATVDAQVQALGTGLQKQIATAFTTTGTSTAYLLTPTPAITAYVANLSFDVTFDEVCGDNPTLQISGVATPPNLVKQLINGSYANIKAGDIPANHRSRVTLLSPTQAWVESLPNLFRIGAGADIASAATLDLTGRTGNVLRITGSAGPITAVTLENGASVLLTMVSTPTFNVAGFSHTCTAGDGVLVSQDGTGAQQFTLLRPTIPVYTTGNQTIAGDKMFTGVTTLDTFPVLSDAVSMVRLNTANGYGSTNNKIARFTTTVTNQGADITYADSATAGASFNINTSGVYSFSWSAQASTASTSVVGFSLNSAQLTTGVDTCTIATVLAYAGNPASGSAPCNASWTGYLPAGSIVRPHNGGGAFSGASVITACRVG